MPCCVEYLVRSPRDLLLAVHHSFVGTAPPLQEVGVRAAPPLDQELTGKPSLIAPMVVTPKMAGAMAVRAPATQMTNLIGQVAADGDASIILATRDGRMSEPVQQLMAWPPGLAMLRNHFPGLAYTLVRVRLRHILLLERSYSPPCIS